MAYHEDDEAPGAAASDRLRVDRWLWCARFYRSRALAAQAVAGGRVHVNGQRVKPARALRAGDRVVVTRAGRDLEFDVLGIPARRGPPPEAQACYAETPASVDRGRRWQETRRSAAIAAPRPDGRPDRKERRELIELARRQVIGQDRDERAASRPDRSRTRGRAAAR